jgi:hypothetical protein
LDQVGPGWTRWALVGPGGPWLDQVGPGWTRWALVGPGGLRLLRRALVEVLEGPRVAKGSLGGPTGWYYCIPAKLCNFSVFVLSPNILLAGGLYLILN